MKIFKRISGILWLNRAYRRLAENDHEAKSILLTCAQRVDENQRELLFKTDKFCFQRDSVNGRFTRIRIGHWIYVMARFHRLACAVQFGKKLIIQVGPFLANPGCKQFGFTRPTESLRYM